MALSESRKQEIIQLVGEGSGDLELDERLTRDEQQKQHLRELHRKREEFLRKCTSAEELDFFAANWERDGREKPIHLLIDNPHTDAGTLLRLYWYTDPEYFYSEYESAAEADDPTERDLFTTLERIERRITGSEYKTASIPFDPAKHVKMSGDGSQLAKPIPPVMYQPITG